MIELRGPAGSSLEPVGPRSRPNMVEELRGGGGRGAAGGGGWRRGAGETRAGGRGRGGGRGECTGVAGTARGGDGEPRNDRPADVPIRVRRAARRELTPT